jgi:uncharacterized delta-60 repeat protein
VSQTFTLDVGPHVVGVTASDGLAAPATGEVVVAVQAPTDPGSLDLSFDPTAGGTRPGFGGESAAVNAVIAQPDGKILAGGNFNSFNGVPCGGLVRLHPDGSLDARFLLHPRTTWPSVNALALQADGKILLTYQHYSTDEDGWFAGLVRLNPDLSEDPTFRVANQWDYVFLNAVAVQPDGKILLGGVFAFTGEGAPYRCVARFHADGRLDRSFQPAPLSSDGEPRNAVNNIVVQPNGRIILLGGFSVPGFSSGGLARLWPDGSLDTNFVRNVPWAYTEDSGNLVLQPDGKIVVAAHFMNLPGVIRPHLLRLHPDGSMDASFQAPKMDYSVGPLARLPDGRFLVSTNQWPESGLARLHQDGTLDESLQVRLGSSGAYVAAIAVQTNGQAIIGGRFDLVNGYPRPGLARLNTGVGGPWVTRELPAAGQSDHPCFVQLEAAPAAEVVAYAVEDQPPAGWRVNDISHGGVFDPQTGKVKFGPFFDALARPLTYSVSPPADAFGVFAFTGMASADGVNSPIGGVQDFLIVGWHPADRNPEDWLLGIGEVTAYGSAWRHGAVWPVAPNPIPIDYVTRAAALWKGGEAYTLDGSGTPPPGCWVNVGWDFQVAPKAQSGVATPAPLLETASRSLPAIYVPGEPLNVSVAAAPGASVQAYAVEDTLPPGWRPTAISHDGEFDTAQHRVKWGPFLDHTPRTLSYEVLPPATASGGVRFVGVSSLDGSSVAIPGAREVAPGCRLRVHSPAAPGPFRLALTGPLGARVLVEGSTDLVDWVRLAELTNHAGQVSFPDPDAAAYPQRFYRSRLIP